MKRHSFRRRLGTGLMALCMLAMMPSGALADSVTEAETEKQQLEEEHQQLENELDALQQQEADKQAEQQDLETQITDLQGQIDSAREEINQLNESINELTLKLEKSEEEMSGTIEEFRQRVVALYRAGSVSTLEILLDSDSLSEFSLRAELLNTMSKRDQELVDKLQQYMDDTSAERTQVEEEKARVAELQKGLESDQEELDQLYQENAAAIVEIQGAQGATENALAANEEELAAAEQRVQEAIAAQKAYEEELLRQQQQQQQQSGAASDGSSSGGTVTDSGSVSYPTTGGGVAGFDSGSVSYPTTGGGVAGFDPCWPLPGVTYISAGYNGYPGHKGLDIAGPYGTAIVAAESGTVIEANNYDSWGYSWGYYVLIYHNGTYTTRYAHMSSLIVSAGQYVEKGQIIGYEGATGNVTGPHLHFEVYQNGTREYPMKFLFGDDVPIFSHAERTPWEFCKFPRGSWPS